MFYWNNHNFMIWYKINTDIKACSGPVQQEHLTVDLSWWEKNMRRYKIVLFSVSISERKPSKNFNESSLSWGVKAKWFPLAWADSNYLPNLGARLDLLSAPLPWWPCEDKLAWLEQNQPGTTHAISITFCISLWYYSNTLVYSTEMTRYLLVISTY